MLQLDITQGPDRLRISLTSDPNYDDEGYSQDITLMLNANYHVRYQDGEFTEFIEAADSLAQLRLHHIKDTLKARLQFCTERSTSTYWLSRRQFTQLKGALDAQLIEA